MAKNGNKMQKIISLIILGSILVFGLVTAGCRPAGTPPQLGEPTPTDGSRVTPIPKTEEGNATKGAEVGDMAPDFELPNLEGQIVSLDELKGKPILLVFWHYRCFICYEEMPLVQEVYEEWSARGLEVVTISLQAGELMMSAHVKMLGFTFPVLLDTELVAVKSYGIPGTPTSFFIDTEGIIQDKVIGLATKPKLEDGLGKIISLVGS